MSKPTVASVKEQADTNTKDIQTISDKVLKLAKDQDKKIEILHELLVGNMKLTTYLIKRKPWYKRLWDWIKKIGNLCKLGS